MWQRTHIPCPCGNSSDAYSIRHDNSGFCFSCGKNFRDDKKDDLLEQDEGKIDFRFRSNWGISRRVMEFYGVETKFLNDEPIAEAYIYQNDAAQVRDLRKPKHDAFRSIGEINKAGCFGIDKFDPGSKEAIIICEGAKDAMSALELLDFRIASISVQSATSAKRDCTVDYDKINSFPKIYICMDNDEAGKKATKSLQGLFDFRKVYHVKLDRHKDVNEYLEHHDGASFAATVLAAKRFAPDNIISSFFDIEKALDESKEDQLGSYPFSTLNERLYGLHAGEVIVFKAPEGVGKTEVFRACEHYLLGTTKHPIGVIHLEEDNATTIKAIAGYELAVPAVLPDCGLSKQDVLQGYKKAVRDDEGRLHIHSSFDVEDEDAFLGNIRFLVSACGCRFIFLDHISWLGTGLSDDDERKKLDRISQKLKLLAKELRFCLVEISHVNDDGKTRGSRNISKVANTVISISRDLLTGSTIMEFLIEKARLGGKTGPAGRAQFNEETGRLEDYKIELPEKKY